MDEDDVPVGTPGMWLSKVTRYIYHMIQTVFNLNSGLMLICTGFQEQDQVFFLDRICAQEYKRLKDVVRETLGDKTYVPTGKIPKPKVKREVTIKGVKIKEVHQISQHKLNP